MAVRDLEPDDLEAALRINEGAVPAVGSLESTRLDDLYRQSVLALCATPDADPAIVAGFALVLAPGADYGSVNYRWFGERYDDFVYLDRVAIDPAHQGLGLGRALYDEVERRVDAEWFTLEVNLRPRNDASLAFHERLGFTEVGRQETDYGALVSMQAKRLR
jgi:predicted GNAT superfamily acetyltransferase